MLRWLLCSYWLVSQLVCQQPGAIGPGPNVQVIDSLNPRPDSNIDNWRLRQRYPSEEQLATMDRRELEGESIVFRACRGRSLLHGDFSVRLSVCFFVCLFVCLWQAV